MKNSMIFLVLRSSLRSLRVSLWLPQLKNRSVIAFVFFMLVSLATYRTFAQVPSIYAVDDNNQPYFNEYAICGMILL